MYPWTLTPCMKADQSIPSLEGQLSLVCIWFILQTQDIVHRFIPTLYRQNLVTGHYFFPQCHCETQYSTILDSGFPYTVWTSKKRTTSPHRTRQLNFETFPTCNNCVSLFRYLIKGCESLLTRPHTVLEVVVLALQSACPVTIVSMVAVFHIWKTGGREVLRHI